MSIRHSLSVVLMYCGPFLLWLESRVVPVHFTEDRFVEEPDRLAMRSRREAIERFFNIKLLDPDEVSLPCRVRIAYSYHGGYCAGLRPGFSSLNISNGEETLGDLVLRHRSGYLAIVTHAKQALILSTRRGRSVALTDRQTII